jgi:hypothetical protein
MDQTRLVSKLGNMQGRRRCAHSEKVTAVAKLPVRIVV